MRAGVAPGEILAITFTKKAAAEIRARLLQRLQQCEANGEAWAGRCLRRVAMAQTPADGLHVHTFHSWFNLLLAGRAWSKDWRGPPQLAENDAPLREEAWRRWLRRAAPDDNMQTALAHCSPAALRKLLQEKFAGKQNIWRLRPQSLLPLPNMQEPGEKLRAQARAFCAGVDAAVGGKALAKALRAAEALLQDGEDERWRAGFFVQDGGVSKLLLKDADKSGCAALLQKFIAAAEDWDLAREEAQAAQFNNALQKLGRDYLEEYEQTKRERHVITFDDLEFMAYEAVEREGGKMEPLLYRLQCRFRHILIDEFQDSSPLQWRVVWRWLHEAAAGDDAPSIFIVGDGKQAIYRFRSGDARLLEVATRFVVERCGAKATSENTCRRCAPPVLDLVNAVFADGYMAGYQKHATAAGVNDSLRGRVEWRPAPPAPPREKAAARPRDPLQRARAQKEGRRLWAAGVAERLCGIVGKARVRADGGERLCRAEDVLVLLPKSTHIGELAQALAERGLPCSFAGGGANFLRAFACADLLALAAALLAPSNALSLARVLRSPMFSFSSDLLTQTALAGGGLWKNLMSDKSAETRRARQCLQRWRQWASEGRLPAHDLLSRIVSDGDLLARYAAATPKAMRARTRADILALLDFALANDGGRAPLLREFLTTAQEESAKGQAGGGGVCLSTVHAAKGLESPVVAVADIAFGKESAADKSDSVDLFVDWPPGEQAPTQCVFRPRRFRRAFAALAKQEDAMRAREDDNLMYVALTRAKQWLLVFAADNKPGRQRDRLCATMEKIMGERGRQENGALVFGDDMPFAAAEEEEKAPPVAAPAVVLGAPVLPQRVAGDKLHRLLALLFAGLPPPEAKKLARADGGQLRLAQKMLASPPLRALLAKAEEARGETSIVEDGVCHRLDLLILGKDNTAWVIDYKSGGDLSAYAEQMRRYCAAVKRLCPQRAVRGAFLTPDGKFHPASA